jgi:MtaA/CmuA family methyltransferase
VNGKERIEAVLAGRKPDRVPVLASSLANAVWLKKIPQHKFHSDAAVLARTVVDIAKEFGIDGVYVSSDNWIIHEALGGGVTFPDDDEPWGRGGPLLKDWRDFRSLEVPDPEKAGRMPLMLEAARRVVEEVGDRLFVEANIDSGPFQLFLTLRGSEAGCLEAVQEPDKVHKFMEFASEVVIAYGRAMAGTGVHAIQFGESSASFVSPELYGDKVLAYDQRVIAALREEGVSVFLHVCGRSSHLDKLLADSGADCLEVDSPVDLENLFATVGSSMTIRGNIDTMLLQNGPVEAIAEAARACLETGTKPHRRFILSPGCGVPKYTPPEHVRILVEVAEQTGL